VKKYKFEDPDFVVVTFDDEKHRSRSLRKKLKKAVTP